MKLFFSLVGLALLAPSVSAPAAVADPRVFAATPPGARASYLVVMREQADLSGAQAIADPAQRRRFVFEALREVADRAQAPLVERLRGTGARFRSHYLINMLEVEADRGLVDEVSSRADVSSVAANRPSPLRRVPTAEGPAALSVDEAAPDAPSLVGPNLVKIRAPEVWAMGFTGQGIVVGDADTGFAWEHSALKRHYRGFDGTVAVHDYNWHDAVHDAGPGNLCGSNAPAPCDDNGHGTSTSGLAVGDDGAGNAIGVAPGARLIGCRNMDNGVGTPARYTECFEFFLAPTDSSGGSPRPELGADVINNSWGCPASEGCTDPVVLRGVVENVRAAGILVVVSAGNGGSLCATVSEAPAIYEKSFSIGATNNADGIAPFSSRGPVTVDGSNRLKPDISAPGVSVRTAVSTGGYTSSFSGTSASAPHVAGAVALLWSAVPALRGNVAASEEILRASSAPLSAAQDCAPFPGADVPNAVFGFGRLDVAGAVAVAVSGGPRLPPHPPDRGGETRVVPPRTP
jgi:subtilisin family serine protease